MSRFRNRYRSEHDAESIKMLIKVLADSPYLNPEVPARFGKYRAAFDYKVIRAADGTRSIVKTTAEVMKP